MVTTTSWPDVPDVSARCRATEEPDSGADHSTLPSAARRSTRRTPLLPSTSTTLAAVTISSGFGNMYVATVFTDQRGRPVAGLTRYSRSGVYEAMTMPAGPAPRMSRDTPGSNRHATRPVRGASAVTAVGAPPPVASLCTSTRPSAAASAGSAGEAALRPQHRAGPVVVADGTPVPGRRDHRADGDRTRRMPGRPGPAQAAGGQVGDRQRGVAADHRQPPVSGERQVARHALPGQRERPADGACGGVQRDQPRCWRSPARRARPRSRATATARRPSPRRGPPWGPGRSAATAGDRRATAVRRRR